MLYMWDNKFVFSSNVITYLFTPVNLLLLIIMFKFYKVFYSHFERLWKQLNITPQPNVYKFKRFTT